MSCVGWVLWGSNIVHRWEAYVFIYRVMSGCYRVTKCKYYRCLCHQFLITSHDDEASRMKADLLGWSALLTTSEESLGIVRAGVLTHRGTFIYNYSKLYTIDLLISKLFTLRTLGCFQLLCRFTSLYVVVCMTKWCENHYLWNIIADEMS